MSTKTWIWIGVLVGSTAGSYVPTYWGISLFSFSSVVWATVGGIVGIWLGFKISHMLGGE